MAEMISRKSEKVGEERVEREDGAVMVEVVVVDILKRFKTNVLYRDTTCAKLR